MNDRVEIDQSWCCCDVMRMRECPIHGETAAYQFSASESAPGMPTIIRAATGRSILATIDRTPVFATLDVAERVLAMLNGDESSLRAGVEALVKRWDKDPARHFAAKELHTLLTSHHPRNDETTESEGEGAEPDAALAKVIAAEVWRIHGPESTDEDSAAMDGEDIARAVLASPWLAAHVSAAETKARADALREAGDEMPFGYTHAAHLLRDRADRIARGDAQ